MARDYQPHTGRWEGRALPARTARTVCHRSVRLGRSCHVAERECSGVGFDLLDRDWSDGRAGHTRRPYRAGTISTTTHTMATTLIRYPLSLISAPCSPTTCARPVPPLPFVFTHPSFSYTTHTTQDRVQHVRLYSTALPRAFTLRTRPGPHATRPVDNVSSLWHRWPEHSAKQFYFTRHAAQLECDIVW